jgi:biotin synthase-like enzyme
MAKKFDQADPMYEKIMATHDAAVSAGLTEYKDPKTGFSVMTEPFLKAKGFCCKNDCRHCPYPA